MVVGLAIGAALVLSSLLLLLRVFKASQAGDALRPELADMD
jgi:hypothetical protein